MWLPSKRHRHEKHKRKIRNTDIGNPTPAHHCISDVARHPCGPNAAVAPRGTDEANVPEAAIATVAAAGTSETSERPPTVAAMAATGTSETNGRPPTIDAVAATGEAASDVSKVVFPFKGDTGRMRAGLR